jgi:hypothetical protein
MMPGAGPEFFVFPQVSRPDLYAKPFRPVTRVTRINVSHTWRNGLLNNITQPFSWRFNEINDGAVAVAYSSGCPVSRCVLQLLFFGL